MILDIDAGNHRMILADLVLRPDPTEVSRSRHVIGAVMDREGLGGLSDDIELIVCELVANAVEHADSQIRVQVWKAGSTIRVEVHDDGEGEPTLLHPPLLAEGGRGLRIVETIATAWGVVRISGQGKTVWAEQTW